jgi:uncharacterized protein (TIGR02246 family)
MQPSTLPNARDAEKATRGLYAEILRRWNERDAAGFAALFMRQGNLVGFDGSQVDGQVAIEAHLSQVFGHHQTAGFVGKVREVRLLGPQLVLLRAVAGMVPPSQSDLNPAVNAIHTLVTTKQGDKWRIELFQSTPAAFHGRPEASEALTTELRDELRAHRDRF